jgi:superfamily II DNA or RNA helicase
VNYEDFLRSKQIITQPSGFEPYPIKDGPFDWQCDIIRWLIRKGKAAAFADCGLGKTIIQLVWADQVSRYTRLPVLIVAPLAVAKQTQREGVKFGYSVTVCRSQTDVQPGINITNYEMLEHFDAGKLGGVVLDESSILKSYMGKTKMEIIDKFKDMPYKLACTATPAPNDHMELLNHAEFLDVMKSSEALSIWFINDGKSSGTYRLKKHAVKSFWEWVSTWAVCMNKPSDIGYSDAGYDLPPLNVIDETVPISVFDPTFQDGFIRHIETSATGFHKEKRVTAPARAERTAEIVNSSNEQFMIWCETNYESDLLKGLLPDADEVRGSDSNDKKEKSAMNFIDGKTRLLISKPSIFGFGLNFQNCHNAVFCGMDYSYESYYQAIRRFWRFGQKKPVNAYIVLGSTEKEILNTIRRKEMQQNEMRENMYGSLKQIQCDSIRGVTFKLTLSAPKIHIPEWLKEA